MLSLHAKTVSDPSLILRAAQPDDEDHILRLNEGTVEVTSPMDAHLYRSIAENASLDIVAEIEGRVVGFLLALRNGASYDNRNFAWFSQRYSDFIYIDRVIVDDRFQGAGIGRCCYSHVMNWARDQQLLFIAAEVTVDPPNPGSLRFHKKFDFEEVGTRELKGGRKVSMLLKTL